jgi:hypothetical protein
MNHDMGLVKVLVTIEYEGTEPQNVLWQGPSVLKIVRAAEKEYLGAILHFGDPKWNYKQCHSA